MAWMQGIRIALRSDDIAGYRTEWDGIYTVNIIAIMHTGKEFVISSARSTDEANDLIKKLVKVSGSPVVDAYSGKII